MRRDLFLKKLDDAGLQFFTVTDATLATGTSASNASLILSRLAGTGFVSRLMRGKWLRVGPTEPNRFALATFLASPHPSYITGPSGLHHHGIIDQIPRAIHAAWPINSKRFQTPLGEFIFHKLPNPEQDDVEPAATPAGPYLIANPAKALVDTARLAVSSRSTVRLFPELDLTTVTQKNLRRQIRQIANTTTRRRIAALLGPYIS